MERAARGGGHPLRGGEHVGGSAGGPAPGEDRLLAHDGRPGRADTSDARFAFRHVRHAGRRSAATAAPRRAHGRGSRRPGSDGMTIPRTLFNDDHDLFRATVRTFVSREITPHYEQWETDGIVPREIWRK